MALDPQPPAPVQGTPQDPPSPPRPCCGVPLPASGREAPRRGACGAGGLPRRAGAPGVVCAAPKPTFSLPAPLAQGLLTPGPERKTLGVPAGDTRLRRGLASGYFWLRRHLGQEGGCPGVAPSRGDPCGGARGAGKDRFSARSPPLPRGMRPAGTTMLSPERAIGSGLFAQGVNLGAFPAAWAAMC